MSHEKLPKEILVENMHTLIKNVYEVLESKDT